MADDGHSAAVCLFQANFWIRTGTKELEKDKNEWKNNTVFTLLSRLGEKKFLKVKKIGRKNEYVATVTEAEYQTMQTHSFLDKVYGGNVKNLVSTLLRQDILSADELKEIETFWRKENEWIYKNIIVAVCFRRTVTAPHFGIEAAV